MTDIGAVGLILASKEEPEGAQHTAGGKAGGSEGRNNQYYHFVPKKKIIVAWDHRHQQVYKSRSFVFAPCGHASWFLAEFRT
jgi:hypothetical protein